MKRISAISGILALSALLARPALACDYPESTVADNIPHGATASAQEMQNAQRDVASYVKELEAYAACVDGEPTAQRQSLMSKRNQAITEAKTVAAKINREIRRYNRSLELRQAST